MNPTYDDRHDRDAARPRRPGAAHRPLWYGLFLVLGMVLAGLGLWAGSALVDKFRARPTALDPNAQLREPTPAAPLDPDETEAVALFERVKDSVVNVDVVMTRQGRWNEPPTELQTSGGSGFVWDADGRVVTNYHVVAEATRRPNTELRVVLADRSVYTAALIGAAPDSDLAVVQITAPREKLKPIPVGTSHDLKVGQKAYAIGNPFGLSLTMTRGIISSVNRIIESPSGEKIRQAIQTDTAINPGNSGGPLLDKSGRLIGVNTSIATPSGGNVGIGFAIPVDTVNRVVTEIIQTGRSLRPDLGVKLYDERKLRQARFDHGVMIERVTPNGAAARAGLRGIRPAGGGRAEPGDLIVGIDGHAINNVEDYERVLRGLKPGQQVTVKYVRDGEEQEATVTVGGA